MKLGRGREKFSAFGVDVQSWTRTARQGQVGALGCGCSGRNTLQQPGSPAPPVVSGGKTSTLRVLLVASANAVYTVGALGLPGSRGLEAFQLSRKQLNRHHWQTRPPTFDSPDCCGWRLPLNRCALDAPAHRVLRSRRHLVSFACLPSWQHKPALRVEGRVGGRVRGAVPNHGVHQGCAAGPVPRTSVKSSLVEL